MTKNKKTIIALIIPILVALVLVVGLSIAYIFVFINNKKVDDMPGGVIGDNPMHIPESELPLCNFTGVAFTKTPCYSPPDSIYL